MRLLFESIPAEFHSRYGLQESVERLQAATKRSTWSVSGDAVAVGTVTAERVRLQRVIPMVRNSFKPFFVGRFETRGNQTVLVGRFTMALVVKIFMCFWLGMVGLFAVGFLAVGAHTQRPMPLLMRFQPLLMGLFGVGLITLGKWFARKDAAWLSDVIGGALGQSISGPQGGDSGDTTAVPSALKISAMVLLFCAITAPLSIILESHIPPGVSSVTSLRSPMYLYGFVPVYSLFCLVLGLGVWRRRSWAWFGGFVFLATCVLSSYFTAPPQLMQELPLPARVLFFVFAVAVMVSWGRWWHGQKKRFVWD